MAQSKMYTIISPPGIKGRLGRKIQRELEHERAKRCLNAKFIQLVYDDGVTCNTAVGEPLKQGASNEGAGPTPEVADIVEEIQSK